MSNKHKNSSMRQPSELAGLRRASAYQGARGFLGMPFIIAGFLFILGGLFALGVAIRTGAGALVMLPGVLVAVIFGLFCFGVSALAGALFDLADCALRAETRARAQEAKVSYEADKAGQVLAEER